MSTSATSSLGAEVGGATGLLMERLSLRGTDSDDEHDHSAADCARYGRDGDIVGVLGYQRVTVREVENHKEIVALTRRTGRRSRRLAR